MAKSKQLSGLDKMFELSKSFDKKDIQWRVQRLTKDGTAGLALAYINVRQVQDRLNEVMGTDWQTKHEVFGAKTICSLGLKLDGDWIWRSDGAGDTQFEADKGAISDSLKRAAVSFGIGRHLYDLPSIWVKCQSKQVGSKYYFQRFTEDPWDKVRQSNSDFS
tara:strand:+ start:651 stop:1136 length:486 start_codon:yes stop_codon:yes gene_type:complete